MHIRMLSGDDLSTSHNGLAFNATTWNTAQVVTMQANEDANVAGEMVRVRHTGWPCRVRMSRTRRGTRM